MWQWHQVRLAIDLMKKNGMNTLIFHQNDIPEQLVYPAAYFNDEFMWKRCAVRMHTIWNNRHYISRLIRALDKNNIKFFIEVKELWFPDVLPEEYPHLWKNGSACPFNPFWWKYIEDKYNELFSIVPGISGVIVSPGTRESKISFAANKCKCPDCKDKTAVEWYTKLIEAMYKPISKYNKTLVIRDFSYSAGNQRNIIEAAGNVSKEIVIALKNTPHDYYPTFPNNPSIGNCSDHPQWVEFDSWGQFFGLGVFPCSVVEDMQARMRHCAKKGVEGVWVRTDWEGVTEGSSFNSLNLLNVFGAGMLSQDVNTNIDDIYRAWTDHGLLSPMKSGSEPQTPAKPSSPEAWKTLKDFMISSWKIIEKSQYVRGHVFNEDDQYCNSVDRFIDIMVKTHGRDDWDPGASLLVKPTDENISIILDEKRQAVKEAEELAGKIDFKKLGFPEDFCNEMKTILMLYPLYVKGFEYCAQGVFYAEKYRLEKNDQDKKQVNDAIDKLQKFTTEVNDFLKGSDYPHYIYWLLDMERLGEFIDDLKARVKQGRTKN